MVKKGHFGSGPLYPKTLLIKAPPNLEQSRSQFKFGLGKGQPLKGPNKLSNRNGPSPF